MAIVVKKYPKDKPFTPATQSEVGFEREGHYIIGWNPKEKRSETTALYRLDQAISFGSNQDLYACWRANLIKISYYRSLNIDQFISSEYIPYGTDGHKPENQPDQIKVGDVTYFKGSWSSPCIKVKSDLTAYLQYLLKYKVSYISFIDDVEIPKMYDDEYYLSGETVTYPTVKDIKYSTFDSFNPQSIPSINGNKNVSVNYLSNIIQIKQKKEKYEYDEDPHPFIVSAEFNNDSQRIPTVEYSEDGSSWSTQQIFLTNPGTKTIHYRVSDPSDKYVTVNGTGILQILDAEVFNAVFYYKKQNQYGIVEDVSESIEVEYGKDATPPEIDKTIKWWKFERWNGNYTHVTKNERIDAEYSDRVMSCYVHSSLSMSTKVETCPYEGVINPNPVCDHKPTDRYSWHHWYTYTNGEVRDVTLDELSTFTQDGLDIYPYYNRLWYLWYNVVSSETVLIQTYNVVSGNSVMASQLQKPTIQDWDFETWNPEQDSWNPINSDTSISAVYSERTQPTTPLPLEVGESQTGSVVLSAGQYEVFMKGGNGGYATVGMAIAPGGACAKIQGILTLSQRTTLTYKTGHNGDPHTGLQYATGGTGTSTTFDGMTAGGGKGGAVGPGYAIKGDDGTASTDPTEGTFSKDTSITSTYFFYLDYN